MLKVTSNVITFTASKPTLCGRETVGLRQALHACTQYVFKSGCRKAFWVIC